MTELAFVNAGVDGAEMERREDVDGTVMRPRAGLDEVPAVDELCFLACVKKAEISDLVRDEVDEARGFASRGIVRLGGSLVCARHRATSETSAGLVKWSGVWVQARIVPYPS